MNPISNIWNHPRTSVAGLLIAAVSIAGVLSQQGISLGKAGTGSVVSLVSALATALLGLAAQDPAGPQPTIIPTARTSTQTARLRAWLLIALLLPLPWLQGCSAASTARAIVNWTPSLQSAVATVDSTAALLAPADAPIFSAATAAFDAESNLLVNQAKAYLANPSAAPLAQLQTQVVTLEQQVNSALLQAGNIKDSASQQHAISTIQAVATIVTAMLALVQSVSSKSAIAQMASRATIKLSAVEPYLNREQSAAIIAAHYNEPRAEAQSRAARVEQSEMSSGF